MTSLIAATVLSFNTGFIVPVEIHRIHPDAATTRTDEVGERENSILTTRLIWPE
ncbi:MAG: hypothetical protein AAGJ34_01450 [Pseudomonadota bacterium]